MSQERDKNPKVKAKSYSRVFPGIVLILFILGLVLFWTWSFYGRSTENEIALALLNEVYKNKRPIESRISKFEYSPKSNAGENGNLQIDTNKLNEVEKLISKNISENPNAENLNTLGRFYLAKKEFYKALAELEKAEKLDSNNAQIQNDLGVAYFEISRVTAKNKDGKSLENIGKAMENFDKAISLDANILEAYFNQSMALQTVYLQNQANEALQEYLEKDSSSPWSIEIETSIKSLELDKPTNKTSDELIKDFLAIYRNKDYEKAYRIVSNNREMIKSKVIPQQLAFLFLESDNQTQKQEYLSALKYIGKMEKEKTGDAYFFEIANYYDSVSKKKHSELMKAQRAIKYGYELSLNGDYKKALDEFSNARELFVNANNKWEAGLSDYWIAYCDSRIDNIKKSTERLEKLLTYCKKNEFKWLAAHATYWLAINSQAIKELSMSIEYSMDSLKFSKDTNDFYNTQKSLSQLADLHLHVNQLQKSYFYLQKSLEMSRLPNSSIRQKARDFDKAARLFYRTRLYSLASNYEKEMLNLYAKEDSSFIHIGLTNISNIYAAQGKFEEALEFAEKGKKVSESLTDERAREKAIGYAVMQIANLEQRKGLCENALSNYERAINIFESMELRSWVFESSKGRLVCNLKNKNHESIEKELPELLKLFEENRNQITEEQNRNSFFDKEQNIYDLAIDYEISKGNFEKAFDYSEKSRSRSLLDMMKSGVVLSEDKKELQINNVTEPQTLNEFKPTLSNEIQILQYAVLDKKIVIWLLSKDRFKGVTSEISIEVFDDKISRFLIALKNRDKQKQQKLSREFYEILIEPLENNLDNSKEIYIIPDKKLFYLPFAALISDKSNRYLIEDYKIAYSPSANVFLTATEKALAKISEEQEKILSVGNPTFSLDNSKGLPDLPYSAKEAKEIAKFYQSPTLLLEKKATKKTLLKSLVNADIIHFAGHYIINEHSPLRSSFLVAKDGENNRLANYELLEENLEKPRLIVLSACQTAIEQYYKGEGLNGAGRTFLALGVPLIVASHWQVEDSATAELMKNFHKYRKTQALSSVSALRRSQLEMLNNENEDFRQPFYWAGFLALGGHAEF